MKKSDLVDRVAEAADLSKSAAAKAIDAIFSSTSGAIAEAVRTGGRLSLPGFGRFQKKSRPARKGRNPQTGVEIDIPARDVITFSAGKGLSDMIAGRSGGGGGGGRGAAGGAKRAGASKTAKKSAGGGAAKKAGGGAAAKKGSGGATAKKAASGKGKK